MEKVNLKLKGVSLDRKGHVPASDKELRSLADGQNAVALKGLENFCVTLGL
jgi:hypothetical protein